MKKFLTIVCAATLALSLFACGTGTPSTSGNANGESGKSEKADTSWTDIEKAGKIVIGVDDEFPPMGFLDEKGEITGFDIDLATTVCEKLGVKAEFKDIDWSSKEAELQTGKINLIWNGYSITSERKEKVDFTKPYLANRQVIITKENYGITKKADLETQKIGAQAQSSAVDAMIADPIYSKIEKNINEYETNVLAMLDLDAGNVKAIVMDEVVADYYLSKHPGAYIIIDEDFGSEEYGVGVKKGSTEFLKKLQTTLDEVVASQKGIEISTKWFNANKYIKK